jgi:hypothetical protein
MSTHAIVLETPIITKQSYASPTSFIGATRRIVPWTLSIARGSPARGVPGADGPYGDGN